MKSMKRNVASFFAFLEPNLSTFFDRSSGRCAQRTFKEISLSWTSLNWGFSSKFDKSVANVLTISIPSRRIVVRFHSEYLKDMSVFSAITILVALALGLVAAQDGSNVPTPCNPQNPGDALIMGILIIEN